MLSARRLTARGNGRQYMPNIDELTKALEKAVEDEDLAEVGEILGQLEEATKDLDPETPSGVSGEKCGPEAAEAPPLYGGAKTFAEADALLTYRKEEGQVSGQVEMYQDLHRNIWRNEDLNLRQKIEASVKLAEELPGRLESPPEYKEAGLLSRIKTLVLGANSESLRDSEFELSEKATKTEDGKAFPASDYAYVPDEAKPSTWKLRLTKVPGAAPDPGIVGAAIAAFSPEGFRGQQVQIPADAVAAVKAKIRAAWTKANPNKDPKTDLPNHVKELAVAQLTDGVFTAWKSVAGDYRWFMTATNKFLDKEAEIFQDSAHQEFLRYLDATKEYPVLRVWHTPGADLGPAEWADYSDGFMVYAGRFNDGEEATAARLVAMGPQGVSHGYKYLASEKGTGVYSWYRTVELTILPPHRAANQWGVGATVIGSKEEEMAFTKEKRDYLLEVFDDEERVKRIEENLASLGKELEGKVAFKDLAEAVGDPEPESEGERGPKPEGEGEGEESAVDSRISTLETQVGEMRAQVEELVSSTKELADGVKVLLKSDEEKLDTMISPRREVPRPTEDPRNIVEAAKDAAGEGDTSDPVDPFLAQLGIKV